MASQPTTTTTVPFTIDNALPGFLSHPDSPDLYRIRIHPEHAAPDGPTIKYLAAPNTSKTLTGPGAHFRRRNNLAFDRVPTGNWIVGQLMAITDKGSNSGKLHLASTTPTNDTTAALNALGLSSAKPIWHDTTVDLADCRNKPQPHSPPWTTITTNTNKEVHLPRPTALQCMDYVSASIILAPPTITTNTTANNPPKQEEEEAVLISDWLPGHWAGIEHSVLAHQAIDSRDPGLAPRFLAHVTENHSRVVGFLLERIPDAREAGPADLGGCRAALARLHALGVVKGQYLARHSFLVRGDGGGEVLVQGPFGGLLLEDGDREEVMEKEMEKEMESLERVLGKTPSVFAGQAARMRRLMDPGRVRKLEEFETAHGFVLPFVYWQESEEGGGRITLTVEQHGVLAKEFEANGYRWTKELQGQAEKRFGPAAKGG